MLITFKHKPCNSYFELCSKSILTKNLNLEFFCFVLCVCGGGGAVGGELFIIFFF